MIRSVFPNNLASLAGPFLAFALTGAACERSNGASSSRPREEATPAAPERLEDIQLPGDPAGGTVVHIRQIHANRHVATQDVAAMRVGVGYQRAVYGELTRRHARFIFLESLAEDYPPERLRDGDQTVPLRQRYRIRDVRAAFPDGFPANPNDVQTAQIYAIGACTLYGLLTPGISFQRMMTAEENRRVTADYGALLESALQRLGERAPDPSQDIRSLFSAEETASYREIVHVRRNQYAAAQLLSFLESHRGKTAFVCYGASHDLRDALNGAVHPPRLESVGWRVPGLPDPTREP